MCIFFCCIVLGLVLGLVGENGAYAGDGGAYRRDMHMRAFFFGGWRGCFRVRDLIIGLLVGLRVLMGMVLRWRCGGVEMRW